MVVASTAHHEAQLKRSPHPVHGYTHAPETDTTPSASGGGDDPSFAVSLCANNVVPWWRRRAVRRVRWCSSLCRRIAWPRAARVATSSRARGCLVMRRTCFLILIGATILTASSFAAASQDVGGVPGGDVPPALVASPSGAAAVVTGTDRGGLQLRRARSGRDFGGPRLLAVNAGSPVLAASTSGLVAFAFLRDDGYFRAPAGSHEDDCCLRLFAGVLARSGKTRNLRRVSAATADARSTVIAAHGSRVAASWLDDNGLQVSGGTFHTGFGPAQTLGVSGDKGPYPIAAIDSAHPHVLTITDTRKGIRVREVWRVRRVHRRDLGLFRAGLSARPALSPTGHLLLVGGALPSGSKAFAIGWRRPGGPLVSTRVRLGRLDLGSGVAAALAPNGRGLVASLGVPGHVRARVVSNSGRVGPVHDAVLPDGELGVDFAVACNDRGAGVLVVTSQDPKLQRRIYAWRLDAVGRIGPRLTLRGAMPDNYKAGLAAAVDARGRARVVWNDGRIHAVRLR